MQKPIDRRTILEFSGAVAVAFAGCTGDQEQGQTETESPTDATTPSEAVGGGGEDPEGGQSPTGTGEAGMKAGTEIKLGGQVSGWTGQAPSSIKGTTNPTLQLKSGADYTLTWENLDGKEHELRLEDDSGSVMVKSNSAEQKGKTVTAQFTARTEMTSYFCEYHPQSMRGNISTGSTTGSGGTATGTQTGDGGY